jgi:hypothetical protein
MTAAAPSSASNRWLFGPVPDLLFGCGLAYAALFVVFTVNGDSMPSIIGPGLLPILSVIGGTPHYGATLLRVYGERESRQKYFFFAVVATAVVWSLFVVGLYVAAIGSILLSLYLTWSPWHYTGQNYGIALMFLGRRGVKVERLEKRLIYSSFLLSYALVLLSIHGVMPGADYAPIQYPGTYRFLTLGLPAGFVTPAFAAAALAYLSLVVVTFALLLRRASLRDLGPTAALFLTQALWFSVPSIARHYGVLGDVKPFSIEHVAYFFAWVAFGHALQYLWVTTYYAQGRRPAGEQLRYYGMCLAAGTVLWGVPGLIFRGPLAPPTGEASVFVMVMAVANIHHFILDGAIWKLRDGRVARVLLRATPRFDPVPEAPRRSLFRPIVAVVGGFLAASTLATLLIGEFWFRHALDAGNLSGAHSALRALSFIGRDDAAQHRRLAQAARGRGDLGLAVAEYQVSIARSPTVASWVGLGQTFEKANQWERAAEAYAEVAALDPKSTAARFSAGVAWRRAGQPAKAIPVLEQALALDPENKLIRSVLDLARRDAEESRGPSAEREIEGGKAAL